MVKKTNLAFTMIELLVVVSIISVLGALAFTGMKVQIAKGRDSRRKADLNRIQNALEDYLNDNNCYPPELDCGDSFSPWLSTVPCDPISNTQSNYFYSVDTPTNPGCKKWYKIYAKLENYKDPVIEKVGCAAGCGPSDFYNYWVSSPNINLAAQLPGELWWPEIGGEPEVTEGSSPTPGSTGTPTPTSGVGVTSTPSPTNSPTTPTPSPVPTGPCFSYSACGWVCGILPLGCGSCCPDTRECVIKDSKAQCCYTQKCPAP
jgi:prepilin-type N-terminal cleavage/methylation domain-containing protein